MSYYIKGYVWLKSNCKPVGVSYFSDASNLDEAKQEIDNIHTLIRKAVSGMFETPIINIGKSLINANEIALVQLDVIVSRIDQDDNVDIADNL